MNAIGVLMASAVLLVALVASGVLDRNALCFAPPAAPLTAPVTLHYFHSRGRAEAIRLVLEYAGVDYIDKRYKWSEWLQVKESGKFPFKQMPLLEHGALRLAQQQAIVRYVARSAQLAGANSTEEAQIDQIAGFSEDMRKAYGKLVYSADAPQQRAAFVAETLPQHFGILETLLNANGGFYGGGKFFVGNRMSYADLLVYDAVDIYARLANDPLLLDAYPALKAHFQFVGSSPRIAKYHSSGTQPKNVNGASAFLDNDGAVKE